MSVTAHETLMLLDKLEKASKLGLVIEVTETHKRPYYKRASRITYTARLRKEGSVFYVYRSGFDRIQAYADGYCDIYSMQDIQAERPSLSSKEAKWFSRTWKFYP